MTNVSDKFFQKTKIHIACSKTFFFRKSCRVWDKLNIEKNGKARQAKDDNITRRMQLACWITKAAGTHLEQVITIAFSRQQLLANVAQNYVYMYSTLPVLLSNS
jgi:hypothetical protein